MKPLLKFFKGYRVQSVLAPLFKCLEAIFELLVPLAVTRIIDVGIGQNDTRTVFLMCGVMLLLGIVGLISAICAQYFSAKTAVGVSTKIRSELFAHIQTFSYADTDNLGTSTLITRMTGDINSVQTGINMFLRLFMRSPFIVFGAMIMAFTIDVRLALIFAVTIPLLAIVVFGIMLISIPILKKSQSSLDSVLGKVRSNFNGTRVVRAFNREVEETADFDEKNNKLTKIQMFAGRISALMNPLTYVIINFAVIILIRSGALKVDSGDITQGELVALYNYMSQILVELIKLASLIITLTKAAASASRVSAILTMPEEQRKEADIKTCDDGSTVKFENVSFAYSEHGDCAIEGISFSVSKGQKVGIIGGTGSGKSTLATLIPGLYSPKSGNVFINGKNTAEYQKDELCNIVGIVPQNPRLFKGSVRSNLEWGNPEATDNEAWDALKLAQAMEFIAEKGGLDTEVTQNGNNFSGGQRQRLTIARALMKQPEILILDDSTSALDFLTESKLFSALSRLEYNPTVFIVSQRAASLMNADIILVLDDGNLVGTGKHEELLATCDVYRDIYYSQFPKGGEQ
ncbi:MAG: ABC transporter ATP-binding protein [Ruminococcaceae bacterium]|nr:ABC transporter ATP-binding protein [Oscillospiraceae bacterium]